MNNRHPVFAIDTNDYSLLDSIRQEQDAKHSKGDGYYV